MRSNARASNDDQLLTITKITDFALQIVALDQPVDRLPLNDIEDLEEDVSARVHGHSSSKIGIRKFNASHTSGKQVARPVLLTKKLPS